MKHDSTESHNLTWAALLGAWTDFAKAAVALPDDDAGTNWKQSVPAIIDLQATVHALAELDRLPVGHRAAAIDTAEAIIMRRTSELREMWDESLPEGIVEVILDAHSAVKAALSSALHTAHHDGDSVSDGPDARMGANSD